MRGRPFERGKSGNPGGRPRVISEVRDLARVYAPAAIKELGRLALKARSESARIAAARELLDRGYGKATEILADEEASDIGPKMIEVRFTKPRPEPNEDDA
jgi:hypothetical protein